MGMGMGRGVAAAAEDAEMRQAFDAAFANLGFTYVAAAADSSARDGGDGGVGASDGESFAATLSAALDAEVQQRRQERQAHIDQYLAPPNKAAQVAQRSACATAPPVALAATPPRATAMA
jgi:hypothetical protein